MKKYEITNEVLESLAKDLLEYLQGCEEELHQYAFEIESGEYAANGSCTLKWEYEDLSFSHEFGIHNCGGWNLVGIEDVTFGWIGYFDECGEEFELSITPEQNYYFEEYINNNI